ncbi:hypothetical protein [Streptomyces sp. NPDC059009]
MKRLERAAGPLAAVIVTLWILLVVAGVALGFAGAAWLWAHAQ